MESMSLLDGVITANFVGHLVPPFVSRLFTPLLAIAAMLTIMSDSPFRGQKDIDQGIAYIAVVVVFFMVRLNYSPS